MIGCTRPTGLFDTAEMKLPFHFGVFLCALYWLALPEKRRLDSVLFILADQTRPTSIFIMSLAIDEIIENFSFIDDWEERYRYVIELGRDLDAFPAEDMTDANKVQGCVSQVWLTSEVSGDPSNPVLTFQGDSDAHIVKGLVAIALATFSGKKAQDIIATDAEEIFNQIGLRDHLTPQRSNGLSAMIDRIKSDAGKSLT